jgi:hypothetical protein
MGDAAARLITIYALTGGGDQHAYSPDTSPSDYEAAERIFGPDVRLKSAPTDLHEWRPKPFGDYEWSPADYSTGKQMPYTVTGAKTYFFNLFAGDALAFELRLRGSLNDYIDAQRDAFDRMVKKQLAGEDLLKAAVSQVNGADRNRLDRLVYGQDKHQIMVLSHADAGFIFSADGDGGRAQQTSTSKTMHGVAEPLNLRRVDFAALSKLMFKDVEINYRPDRTPISLPDDINGPNCQMVAVWASNTVVCGIEAYNNLGPDYGDLGARRIRELTYVAAQIVAATNRCREIRMATLSVLRHLSLPASLDQASDQEHVDLIRYEGELQSLEIDLTWGIDVYRGPALVRGGRPLERYQEAVRAEGGFDASVALTHRMVDHLTSIVTRRRQIFDVRHQTDQLAAINKLLDRTEGVKTASIVIATIVVVVSCVGLFATLAAVPVSTGSLFLGPQFRSAAAAALSVIFAGVLGFGVYVASKARVSGNARKLVIATAIALAVFCLAGLGLAVVLWPHSGTAVHWYALIGGMMAGLAAIILSAWLVDFDENRKGRLNR